jgi:hypothetical protein
MHCPSIYLKMIETIVLGIVLPMFVGGFIEDIALTNILVFHQLIMMKF